jgi:Leucine-rich repeat (LRR) protein
MKFPPASLSNGQLRELAPYANVFSKLSLVASGIGDDGLYHIGKMENVRSLFLQKTKLNGSGLVHLRHLENLEVLNLSFTAVDDKAALDLLKIPNLREVYLYRTKVSADVIKALQDYRPTLKILLEEGPYL